jgi:hypothetical protein
LAWDLIGSLHEEQVLPFQWVIGDEHFGNNPVLLDQIALADLFYLAAAMTVAQVRRLLQVILAKRQLDAETVIALIQYIQDQNYRAYCAHRKRRLRRLDSS